MRFSHLKFTLDSPSISQRTVEICGSAIKKCGLYQNEWQLELLDPLGPTISCGRSASVRHGEELHPHTLQLRRLGRMGKSKA